MSRFGIQAVLLLFSAIAAVARGETAGATATWLTEIGLPFACGLHALFALLSLWFAAARVREAHGMELEAMSG